MRYSTLFESDSAGVPGSSRRSIPGLATILMGFGLTLVAGLILVDVPVARSAPPATPAPQAIAGVWKANCYNSSGMLIEMTLPTKSRAVGTIKALGMAAQFGYRLGQEIIRLDLGKNGVWNGQLLWRNTARVERWQPITFRLVGATLDGRSANEHCYEEMERAR